MTKQTKIDRAKVKRLLLELQEVVYDELEYYLQHGQPIDHHIDHAIDNLAKELGFKFSPYYEIIKRKEVSKQK